MQSLRWAAIGAVPLRSSARLAAVLLVAAAPLGCQSLVGSDRAAEAIGWGTSFGECIGYCRQELRVTPSTVRLVQSSWQPAASPDRVYTESFERAAWDRLSAAVRASGFYGLRTTYGCPDCVDGGAEWVEVEGLRPRRVTFEYGANPKELDDVVAQLRAIYELVAPCPSQSCALADRADLAKPGWTQPRGLYAR